jgi:hypothetical protein
VLRVVQIAVALALATAANFGHFPSAAVHPGHPAKAPNIDVGAVNREEAAGQLAEVRQQRADAQAEERAAEAAAAAEAAREAAAAQAAAQAQQALASRVAAPMAPSAPIQPASQIQQLIVNAFKSMGDTAVQWGLRVAKCESGYNPRAYNPAGPYYGLFQFLQSTFNNTPYRGQDIYDAGANAGAAAWKYGQGGQSAWGCN